MSYPVDIESVKNTKLFKKFMESKNKSVSVSGPRIQNVDINVKPQQHQNIMNSMQKNKIEDYPQSPKIYQQEQDKLNVFPSYPREGLTLKRNFESQPIQQPKREIQYQSSQRKNENRSKQRPISRDDTDLGKKYEKLAQQYSELKEKVTQQRKQTRKQMIKLEQQVQILTKKTFQLRNREDQLIVQNKRLKQKSAADTKQKLQVQQQNRELVFQIQQLRDMVDGQQNSSKRKQDQALHWRKINDDLKQRVRELELQIVRLKDMNNVMEREKYVIEKEIGNKESHLNEMREKINSMITENGVLRDQIFHITSKLYHFEQENKALKADLRRHSDDFPMAYLQQTLQQVRQSRPQSQSIHENSMGSMVEGGRMEPQHDNVERRTERRRGQFARERGLKRGDNPNVTHEQRPMTQQHQPQQQMVPTQQNKNVGEAFRKLEQLNEQLQKLKDSKAMNGTMRRQKITLERQIQQLEQFVKNNQ